MFGKEFKDRVKVDIANDKDLEDAVCAFILIGGTRNQLIHLNLASFILDKTAEEVYVLYQSALNFLTYIEKKLHQSIVGKVEEPSNEVITQAAT